MRTHAGKGLILKTLLPIQASDFCMQVDRHNMLPVVHLMFTWFFFSGVFQSLWERFSSIHRKRLCGIKMLMSYGELSCLNEQLQHVRGTTYSLRL